MQECRAYAWTCVATAARLMADAERAEEAASIVGRILNAFPDEMLIRDDAAEAWGNVAAAVVDSDSTARSRAERAAHAVDHITKAFHTDPNRLYWRAVAWRHVARARLSDAPAAQRAAEIVDEIGRHVARARLSDAPAAQRAAEIVDEIGVAFPEDRPLATERAWAWCHVAHAFSLLEDGRTSTERAAERTDEVATSCPKRLVQKARAFAWMHVAIVRLSTGAGASAVADAVRVIDDVARVFATDDDVGMCRAQVWRMIAVARADAGDRPSYVEEAMRIVDAVAESFPGKRDFIGQQALAWLAVARACRGHGDREQAQRYAAQALNVGTQTPDTLQIERSALDVLAQLDVRDTIASD